MLVLLAGCSATHLPWDTGDRVALAAMAGCQAFDSATTVYGIEHEGMEEKNPIMPNSGWANIPVKIAMIGAFGAVAHLAPSSHASRRVILGIGAAAGCVPGAINASRF